MGRHAPVIHATRKPSTIEAMQLTDDLDTRDDIVAWVLSYGGIASVTHALLHVDVPTGVVIQTVDGNTALVKPGWYVIKGTHGEFYPCKQDIFEANYDVVD